MCVSSRLMALSKCCPEASCLSAMQITGVGSRIVVQVASVMIMIVAVIGESSAK